MNERMNERLNERIRYLNRSLAHKTVGAQAHAQIALIWQRAQSNSAKQLIAINGYRQNCMIFSIRFDSIQFNSIHFDFPQFKRFNTHSTRREKQWALLLILFELQMHFLVSLLCFVSSLSRIQQFLVVEFHIKFQSIFHL